MEGSASPQRRGMCGRVSNECGQIPGGTRAQDQHMFSPERKVSELGHDHTPQCVCVGGWVCVLNQRSLATFFAILLIMMMTQSPSH